MLKIYLKRFSIFFLFCCLIIVTLACITNVPKDLTRDDELAFQMIHLKERVFGKNSIPSDFSRSYEEEVRIIKKVQEVVFEDIEIGEGIPEFEDREPLDLIKHKTGLCYDRSRMIEKALQYLGFKTRHVYVLYPEGKNPIIAMMTYRQPSHALSEVKTSKGWAYVESLKQKVGFDENNKPLITEEIGGLTNSGPEWHQPYLVIKGMYSRKGFFYRPRIPFPELNWPDLFNWLIYG